MSLPAALEELAVIARSLYERGYTFGTAGNLSIRSGDTIYITPTNSSFGRLAPESIASIGVDGARLDANVPSKEWPFHLAAYRARPDVVAVVHLHSTHSTAVASLANLNTEDALPPITPYYVMRVKRLPVVPYLPPGDPAIATHVEALAPLTDAILLRNHGLITLGPDLFSAAALAEEVEEQARLFLLLGERARLLTPEEIAILANKRK